MKKILVVGQTPPPFGGQALMIRRLLDGNYRNAFLYHVRMSFSKDMDDIGKFQFRKLFHPIGIVAKAVYLRVRHNIDTLYYPPSGPDRLPMLRDIVLLLCLRWMFKKTIFHFHAAGTSELYSQLPDWLRVLYRWSYFRPDMAIQLSDFNPDDGTFLQAREKRIVPNGIEDDYAGMGSSPRPVHPICNVLFVGLICESKGILVLIDAVRRLKEGGVPVKVTVLGKFVSESFQRIVMEKITEWGLEARFDFKGVLTGRDKGEQYLNADIFCFPTFFESESFGLVVAEAMQFCVPVVVTRWRGVQSLVDDGENGFLVSVRDGEAIAEKISVLISDPELRLRMGEKGRKKFLREYTVEKFYQRMDECFANT